MSQIEIVEDTVWIPITSNVSIDYLLGTEEYIYIAFLIISLLYSIRLLNF